ncbi:MAG TPA: hypothetical protein VE054_12135, partial [Blattabacteriaceae bacterium]|nr:hypothetical protein [Blattabacteriaceae bacterium]
PEVIAEFLRGEFFQKEYDADRERFASLVENPNLTDAQENEIRRILLFRRRDTMWWELPEDRQWWEIEFEPEDVEQVSVFPRAHWRKIARGNFKAVDVAARIRQLKDSEPNEFAKKISEISSNLSSDVPQGMVIFLGIDEHLPVTLLEGNHRFIASLLAGGPQHLRNARMVAVFSPQMEKCCWYKTNLRTLARCLKNRIQHHWDRDADLARLLAATAGTENMGAFAGSTRPLKFK